MHSILIDGEWLILQLHIRFAAEITYSRSIVFQNEQKQKTIDRLVFFFNKQPAEQSM